MKISKESAEILGLSQAETLVIKLLNERKLTIADISIESKIPRTSLYYILPKLEIRGFLEKRKINRKTVWKNTNTADFEKKYSELVGNICETGDKEHISRGSTIKIYKGTKELFNIFLELSHITPKSRFFGIQPDASIVEVIKKTPLNIIVDLNKSIKKNGIIVEAIVHERSVDSLKEVVKEKREDAKQFFESFGGRSADTVKLPDNFLDKTKAEIYLYENKIAIMNWDKEFAVTIENDDVFELLKEMFKSTKYLLERYDQNEKIARKLVDLKK